jgi:hypothetical protein
MVESGSVSSEEERRRSLSPASTPPPPLDSVATLRVTAAAHPGHRISATSCKSEGRWTFLRSLLHWRPRTTYSKLQVLPSVGIENHKDVDSIEPSNPTLIQRLSAAVIGRHCGDGAERSSKITDYDISHREIRLLRTRFHRNLDEGAEGQEKSRLVSTQLRLNTLRHLALRHFSTNITTTYRSHVVDDSTISIDANKYAELHGRIVVQRDIFASDVSDVQDSDLRINAPSVPVFIDKSRVENDLTLGSVLPEVQDELFRRSRDEENEVKSEVLYPQNLELATPGGDIYGELSGSCVSPKKNPKQLKLKIVSVMDATAAADARLDVVHPHANANSSRSYQRGAATATEDVFVSATGTVHGGNWKIEESGLSFRSSQSPLNISPRGYVQHRVPRKFEYLEVGSLGSGASGSVVEALHIPSLTLVAIKRLPVYDVDKLQSVAREISVLYGNLNDLRDRETDKFCSIYSNKCPNVLGLYDGNPPVYL